MNQHWEQFEAGQKHKRPVRWLWQRLTRGYDDRDVYDLDEALVRFAYPRLKHFITWQCDHGMSCPPSLDPAAWLEVLRKIEKAFDIQAGRLGLYGLEETKAPTPAEWTEESYQKWLDTINEEDKQIKEGIELFGKYLLDLFG